MRPSQNVFVIAVSLLLASTLPCPAQAPPAATQPSPALADRIRSMEHHPGLLPLDWDSKDGKLYMEVPLPLGNGTLSPDYIHAGSLPEGVGQNDLGLDRGQLSHSALVHFQRLGNKVLLIEPNLAFRTQSPEPAEQQAVRQSFPVSVLAGFTVAAASPDGTVLLDVTDWLLRDSHHVAESLAAAKQGAYHVDPARSAVFMESSKAFPKNTELEALLTFSTDDPSHARLVGDVTPDTRALTVHEHHSFLELPPPGFTPRRFNPRSGYFDDSFREMNAPLGDDLTQRFIIRHRLIKRDPSCTSKCVAVAPVQYFVDRGAPEPIRSALLDGVRWWDQAFQAAGWAPGTFRADLLPEAADALDVRYNMIQWVHRYNRGWSYGSAITDPRTGEILKGNVTLGSLRARQDYLIAEALLSPYANPRTDPAHDPMLQMVLSRLRQLAAHETGHTLGLAHNYIASSLSRSPDETVSVMDYPHPYVTLDAHSRPDISHAYPVGIGTWDKVAIDYGYREFDRGNAPAEDPARLDAILTAADKAGFRFITDADSRPFGSAHPYAHLWDNGADPAVELDRVLAVRAAALAHFGANAVRPGTPMAQLEETLVPLFLFHRYQTEAAIKEIGGLNYLYNERGDGLPNPTILDPAVQKRALETVLKTLSPEVLTLPESILALLPPHPPGYPRTDESFPSHTGLTFDPIGAAESSADLTLAVLLDPARASRLIEYHMRLPASPSLRGVLEAVSKTTAERPESGHSMSSEIERAVEFRALEAMLSLAVNPAAASQARAITRSHLKDVLQQLTAAPPLEDTAEAIHRAALIGRLQEFERDPAKFTPAPPVPAPPGMPIGEDEDF